MTIIKTFLYLFTHLPILMFSTLFIFNSVTIFAATPLEISAWDLDSINASRVVYNKDIRKDCGKENHYLSPIVTGKHLTFLDHTTLDPLSEFMVGKLAGKPIYDAEGCYVFITSEDGWIWKYNLKTGIADIKIRVGLKTANSALSGNGNFLLVGNKQPATLIFLNPKDLSVIQIIPVQDRKGILSPVNVVRNGGELHGFIIAPQNFPEIWKISYLDPPPIGFGDGWNHDYRCLKDHMDKPLFPIKRMRIEQTLDNFYIDEKSIYLLGTNTAGEGIIFDLDLSRIVGHLNISSISPDLIWEENDATQLVILNNDKTSLSFYGNTSAIGKWRKEADIDSAVGHISTISTCPQSKTILLGGESGKIQIVNRHSHETESILQIGQGHINQASCSEDQKYMLLELGDEKKLVIYDKLMQKKIR